MKKALQIALPLLLAAGLLWWVLKDLPFASVRETLAAANWWLVGLSLVPTVLSHLARAKRWQLLLEPVAQVPTIPESFAAIMAGYVANLAAPRFGEVVRCTLLTRRRPIPAQVSLGTVIAERAFDLVMLALVLGLSLLLQAGPLLGFFERMLQGKTSANTAEKGVSGLLLIVIASLISVAGLAWLMRGRIGAALSRLPFWAKVAGFVQGLAAGIFSALRLKNRGQFLLLTLAIWVGYYLSAWVCLEAVPGVAGIGPLAALLIFCVGSFGMVAPVQGGYGPFEFMVIAGLTQLYATPEGTAAAAALLMHNSQTLLTLAVGLPCLLWLGRGKK